MSDIRKFLDAVKDLDTTPVLDSNSVGVLGKEVPIVGYKTERSVLDKFYRTLGIPIFEVSRSELGKYGDVAGVNIGDRAMVADYLAPEERAAVAAHEAGHKRSMDQKVAQLYAIKTLAEARDSASDATEYKFFTKALRSALRSARYFGLDVENRRKAA